MLVIYFIGLANSLMLLLYGYFETGNFLFILPTFVLCIIFIFLIYYERKTQKLYEDILQSLRRILKGNFNTKVYIKGNKKLLELAQVINEVSDMMQKKDMAQKKLEESRKRLFSNISHDLRTPLTSIIGYIDALRDGVALDEKEQKDYMDIIVNKGKNLKKIIDEIFYMAKLDADDLVMEFEILDLGEVIRECIIEFLPEISKNNMEIKVNIPEKKLPVYADRLSIIRIVDNLIKNGIIHGKEGKILGIDVNFDGKYFKVSIWDRGPGIPSEDLPYVFDRLYTTDRVRNFKTKSSGLGLAIVKKLIEKHQGNIWVNSITYKKTEFIFTIPRL